MKIFRVFLFATIVSAFLILILFIPLTYKIGIDGVLFIRKIPFYAKIGGFLYRDYQYRALSKEITEGLKTDTSKVLAIYDWTTEHIKRNKPEDWPVRDDHILDIIIRGYGEQDQIADVFTTLCTYSGIRAFWRVYYFKEKIQRNTLKQMEFAKLRSPQIASLVLSFVKSGDRWLVFDVYNNKYFLNNKGEIASLDDLLKDPSLIEKNTGDFKIKGLSYAEFFKHIEPIEKMGYLRSEKQMLHKRILFELFKKLKS